MKYPIFVAFSCDNLTQKSGKYKAASDALRARCDELGIECDIQHLDLADYLDDFSARNPNMTTMRRAIFRYVPIFVLDMLEKHNRPLLYLHCDSVVQRKPPASAFEPDMTVGYQQRSAVMPELALKRQIFASPFFVQPGREAQDFFTLWKLKCQMINDDNAECGLMDTTIQDLVDYPGIRPFKEWVASEYKQDDPPILFGQYKINGTERYNKVVKTK